MRHRWPDVGIRRRTQQLGGSVPVVAEHSSRGAWVGGRQKTVASAGSSPRRPCGALASSVSLLGGVTRSRLSSPDLADVQQQAARLRADIAFARRIAGAIGGGQPLPGPSARVKGFLDQGVGFQALGKHDDRALASAGPAEGADAGMKHAHQGRALAGGRRAAAVAMVAAAAELAHALRQDV